MDNDKRIKEIYVITTSIPLTSMKMCIMNDFNKWKKPSIKQLRLIVGKDKPSLQHFKENKDKYIIHHNEDISDVGLVLWDILCLYYGDGISTVKWICGDKWNEFCSCLSYLSKQYK